MAKTKNAIQIKMAQAAEDARQSYPKGGTSLSVAQWMDAHYIKAGYKNLSKIMMQEEGIRPVQSLLQE